MSCARANHMKKRICKKHEENSLFIFHTGRCALHTSVRWKRLKLRRCTGIGARLLWEHFMSGFSCIRHQRYRPGVDDVLCCHDLPARLPVCPPAIRFLLFYFFSSHFIFHAVAFSVYSSFILWTKRDWRYIYRRRCTGPNWKNKSEKRKRKKPFIDDYHIQIGHTIYSISYIFAVFFSSIRLCFLDALLEQTVLDAHTHLIHDARRAAKEKGKLFYSSA